MLDFIIKKYKKYINYVLFGFITVIISVCSFKLFLLLNIKYVISFTMSQILAITFAYFATRKTVYKSKANDKKEIIKEGSRFFIGRVFTYIVNLILIIIFVDVFKFDAFYSNIITTVIVIILNYIVGDIMINKIKNNIKN